MPLPRQCPTKKQEYDLRTAEACRLRRMIDAETGTSAAQRSYVKAMQTKRNTVDENGITILEKQNAKARATKNRVREDGTTIASDAVRKGVVTRRKRGTDIIGSKKAVATKKTKLSNGLTIGQNATRKAIDTKRATIDEDGKNLLQKAGHKSYETKKNTYTCEGQTIAQSSVAKMKATLRDQSAEGLTHERARRGARTRDSKSNMNGGLVKRRYLSTDLWYQGSYELAYLDDLVEDNGLDWVTENVSRGPTITYISSHDDKEHLYFSDFLIKGSTVVEIKSTLWWDWNGNDLTMLLRNYQKLEATTAKGFDVVVVLNKAQYVWNVLRLDVQERLKNGGFDVR